MPKYYVNARPQAGGEHEVHEEGCAFMPKGRNALYLGGFTDCRQALAAAARHFRSVDGCYYCCRPCHTT